MLDMLVHKIMLNPLQLMEMILCHIRTWCCKADNPLGSGILFLPQR